MLTSDSILIHYSNTAELLLAADASPYGVGAVLSHQFNDGTEKPVAYASISLSKAEKNYSQLDKEVLAIVFVITQFRQYLARRHSVILSDHKPFQHMLASDKAFPAMASARLQRWALLLSAYDYTIQLGEKSF